MTDPIVVPDVEQPLVGYRPQVINSRGKWVGCGDGKATELEAAEWAFRCCLPGGEWRTVEVTTRPIRSGKYGEEPQPL